MLFTYPKARPHRRHGPYGYSDYQRYRPWLRDEFEFRCVYCLEREIWTKRKRAFDIDHIVPISQSTDGELDYENLAYSCARCNGVKSDQAVQDPFFALTDSSIRADSNGVVTGTTPESKDLIRKLDLNCDDMIKWRCLKLEHETLVQHDSKKLASLTRLPEDLPDLSRLNRKPNTRPEGVSESWYERRKKEELD